jgi:hypothetical protein
MHIELTGQNEESIEYEITDAFGNTYGIHDVLNEEGMIIDTLVVSMETLDEVEDSELFKQLVTLRRNFNSQEDLI